VEDAVDLLEPASAARQVTIETALGDVRGPGDRVPLEWLGMNVLDNAVRHNVPRRLGTGDNGTPGRRRPPYGGQHRGAVPR
jgi:hypothetical protein